MRIRRAALQLLRFLIRTNRFLIHADRFQVRTGLFELHTDRFEIRTDQFVIHMHRSAIHTSWKTIRTMTFGRREIQSRDLYNSRSRENASTFSELSQRSKQVG